MQISGEAITRRLSPCCRTSFGSGPTCRSPTTGSRSCCARRTPGRGDPGARAGGIERIRRCAGPGDTRHHAAGGGSSRIDGAGARGGGGNERPGSRSSQPAGRSLRARWAAPPTPSGSSARCSGRIRSRRGADEPRRFVSAAPTGSKRRSASLRQALSPQTLRHRREQRAGRRLRQIRRLARAVDQWRQLVERRPTIPICSTTSGRRSCTLKQPGRSAPGPRAIHRCGAAALRR